VLVNKYINYRDSAFYSPYTTDLYDRWLCNTLFVIHIYLNNLTEHNSVWNNRGSSLWRHASIRVFLASGVCQSYRLFTNTSLRFFIIYRFINVFFYVYFHFLTPLYCLDTYIICYKLYNTPYRCNIRVLRRRLCCAHLRCHCQCQVFVFDFSTSHTTDSMLDIQSLQTRF